MVSNNTNGVKVAYICSVAVPTPWKDFETMGNQKDKVVEIITYSRDRQEFQSSGEIVQASGLYSLKHQKHPIQEELLVVKGTALPFCPVCKGSIHFYLTQKIVHADEDPDLQQE